MKKTSFLFVRTVEFENVQPFLKKKFVAWIFFFFFEINVIDKKIYIYNESFRPTKFLPSK